MRTYGPETVVRSVEVHDLDASAPRGALAKSVWDKSPTAPRVARLLLPVLRPSTAVRTLQSRRTPAYVTPCQATCAVTRDTRQSSSLGDLPRWAARTRLSPCSVPQHRPKASPQDDFVHRGPKALASTVRHRPKPVSTHGADVCFTPWCCSTCPTTIASDGVGPSTQGPAGRSRTLRRVLRAARDERGASHERRVSTSRSRRLRHPRLLLPRRRIGRQCLRLTRGTLRPAEATRRAGRSPAPERLSVGRRESRARRKRRSRPSHPNHRIFRRASSEDAVLRPTRPATPRTPKRAQRDSQCPSVRSSAPKRPSIVLSDRARLVRRIRPRASSSRPPSTRKRVFRPTDPFGSPTYGKPSAGIHECVAARVPEGESRFRFQSVTPTIACAAVIAPHGIVTATSRLAPRSVGRSRRRSRRANCRDLTSMTPSTMAEASNSTRAGSPPKNPCGSVNWRRV